MYSLTSFQITCIFIELKIFFHFVFKKAAFT